MLYVFDLDGTLIDSRDAVLAAYRSVGVEPPADFFGKPWRAWLNDETKHAEKNAAYLKMIREGAVKDLPLMELYHTIARHECPYILTGASRQAATAIAIKMELDTVRLYFEMGLDDKIQWMRKHGTNGVMFEDDAIAARTMRRETRWSICHMLL